MGRPRKRRREGEAEETAGSIGNVIDSTDGNHESTTTFADFGIITPPQMNEQNYLGDLRDGMVPDFSAPSQHNYLGTSEGFGPSPISNIE
jgi:hypothetical protein